MRWRGSVPECSVYICIIQSSSVVVACPGSEDFWPDSLMTFNGLDAAVTKPGGDILCQDTFYNRKFSGSLKRNQSLAFSD